ncbi:Pfs, NACHT and WD domain protein [Cordyceps javanica]|nr:Pfs, NACHT and WD domain protein [Cordyceps javanica]
MKVAAVLAFPAVVVAVPRGKYLVELSLPGTQSYNPGQSLYPQRALRVVGSFESMYTQDTFRAEAIKQCKAEHACSTVVGYLLGDYYRDNYVVIATLPAGQEYETGSAAALASQVKKTFPNIWFGLLVGVAAGLPKLTGSPPRDIRLGDVLVALPEGDSAGLLAYDLGRETGSHGFQLLTGGHVLAVTEPVVRAAIGSIKRRAPNDAKLILPYYNKINNEEHDGDGETFADPGQDADRPTRPEGRALKDGSLDRTKDEHVSGDRDRGAINNQDAQNTQKQI